MSFVTDRSPFPEILPGWNVSRLKFIGRFASSGIDKKNVEGQETVSMVNYTDVYNNSSRVLDTSKTYMLTTCSEGKKEAFELLKGDLLFTPSSETTDEIGFSALVMEDLPNTVFSYHLTRFRFSKPIHLNYRKYLCQNYAVLVQFARSSKGSTRKILGRDEFNNAKVIIPPYGFQKQIADYLDRETAQIDALVKEKENMLALLEEKRGALISHAVTRGLNPNAALKPSGLNWLGDMPKHWSVERAKGLFREVDDRTTTGEEELLSLRMHVGLVPHHDVSDKILEPKDVIGFKKVDTGQLVINRMRASMGLIALSTLPGLVSPDYAVFDVVRPIHVPYFLALFNTQLLGALFRSSSKGIGTGSQGFLRLYSESFLSIHLPVPPTDEQKKITDFLTQDRERTSELENTLTESITLLKERRSALITAAITGQIEPEAMTA